MLDFLTQLIWGKVLVAVLIALGLLLTITSRFVQFRYFGRMFRLVRRSMKESQDQINSFQALSLTLAGRVGAGNIAGVAIAIALGGPGAVFWMWLIGLIGMGLSFFECSLAQLFKRRDSDGSFRGGPAYYIHRGLGLKWLAVLFSVLLLVTFGFAFNALQAHTVASTLKHTFGIATPITGSVLVVFIGLIIFGGVRRIAEVAEVIVPIMVLAYFGIGLYVIGMNYHAAPATFLLIFKSAFALEPAFSGLIGTAIMMGVKQGMFSNEAGLGSAPNVSAAAKVGHPADQGIVQAFSVFMDTMVLCTCTAMIILMSNSLDLGGVLNGVELTQLALAKQMGELGRGLISLALMLFAFTSIIYNYYLGENSLRYLNSSNEKAVVVYRMFTLGLVMWGALQNLAAVFAFADITMGLLALVNLVALFMLLKVGLRLLRDYDEQIQSGVKSPVFDPDKFADLDIDHSAWVRSTRDESEEQNEELSVSPRVGAPVIPS
ncbi:Na+/alanine symporter [Hahella chejuensis KCTC 2396]|uniref:Na+/alanine symporter n=1 Tax=Hahella chejuensis (strain KCTC 2396) TaxID=349521 RepID=Q2SF65_HAHCH|nr:alanine/glycine:cation symporter family protein [Hahella chejuensis]ABC30709.1 Na+/alanine symporter [Hahella chejuensis KCTC 2396]